MTTSGGMFFHRRRSHITAILLLSFTYFRFASSCASHATNSLKKNKELYCRRCGALITTANAHVHVDSTIVDRDRSMPLPELADGATLSHFKNSQGTNFGVATFCPASQNLEVSGVPESRDSFYPPYKWQVVTCKKCGSHLGWRFLHDKDPKSKQCPLNLPLEEKTLKDQSLSTSPSTSTVTNKKKNTRGRKHKAPGTSASMLHMDEMGRLDEILKKLKGLCQAVSRGYWTYEWCFRKHVRQFHLEPLPKNYVADKNKKDAVLEVNKIKYLRSPDWSLGGYTLEKEIPVSVQWDKPEGNLVYISNYFVDGQHCDETGSGRHTEVRLMCCQRDRKIAAEGPTSSNNLPKEWQRVSVRNIEETATCRYLIDVCVAALCDLKSFYDNGFIEIKADNKKSSRQQTSLSRSDVDGRQPSFHPAPAAEGCVFHGLLWDRLISRDADALRWVAAVKPVTGLSQ